MKNDDIAEGGAS